MKKNNSSNTSKMPAGKMPVGKMPVGIKPMDAALDYLTARARTVREVEDKLDSLNYGEYEVYQVVERLKELNYLNDEKYAADFVASRLSTRPVSRRKLWSQLWAHKLPQEIIEDALSSIGDDAEMENALRVAKKFDRQFGALETEERKQRVTRRLMGRGYDYAAAKAALEAIYGDAEGIDFSASAGEDEDEGEE